MNKKNIFYIADFSLPNMSAYTLHVLKMCDAFSEKQFYVNLLLPFVEKDYDFMKTKKEYLLKSFFKIKKFFKKKHNRNIFFFLLYSLKILKFLNKQKPSLIISRSVLPALFLSLFKHKIILELHTEPRGITGLFFFVFKKFKSFENVKFILIHENLNKKLRLDNSNFIVLDDCVDFRDFEENHEKDSSCAYTGSYVKGKGIETIVKIAEQLPKIKFNLYGNIKTLDESLKYQIKKISNINLNDFKSYNEITKILAKNKVLLMPYENEIGVLIKGLDVSDYISPLKLFDYLASGSLIIASKKKVYDHILKDKFNCFLIDSTSPKIWGDLILELINEKNNFEILKLNAINTAKKYSWLIRIEKIIEFTKI